MPAGRKARRLDPTFGEPGSQSPSRSVEQGRSCVGARGYRSGFRSRGRNRKGIRIRLGAEGGRHLASVRPDGVRQFSENWCPLPETQDSSRVAIPRDHRRRRLAELRARLVNAVPPQRISGRSDPEGSQAWRSPNKQAKRLRAGCKPPNGKGTQCDNSRLDIGPRYARPPIVPSRKVRYWQIVLQKYFGARPREGGQKMIPARLG